MNRKLLFFLLLFPNILFARTFYVSSSYTGSISNGALATPWKSLATVQSRMDTIFFVPGDTISFKSGDTFVGTLNIKKSGTSGNPIVLNSYGIGAKPRLIGTGATIDYLIQSNNNYLIVDGFQVIDTALTDTGRREIAHIRIAVTFRGTYCIAKNNEISRAGIGIYISQGRYATIDSNVIHHLKMIVNDTILPDNDYGGAPIWLAGNNNTVTNNTCYSCWGISYDYGTDGGGFEFFDEGIGAKNNYMAYNTMYENNGLVETSYTGACDSNTFVYNKFVNNGNVVYLQDSCFGWKFYNNVIVENLALQGAVTAPLFSGRGGYMSQIELRNNIFQKSTAQSVVNTARFFSFTHTNNIYKLSGTATLGFTLGTAEISTAAVIWISTIGLPQVWDYNLVPGSPAINAGINVGLARDFAGNIVSNPPDAGVYEVVATATSPTITTTAAFSINTSIATSGGNITTDGGSTIIRRGLMYSTSAITDTTTGTKVVDGSLGTGTFTTSLTGLIPSTQYHIRAFALNSVGVSYGADLTFTTLAVIIPPTVTTTPASSIGATTATTGGNVTTDGGATVISRGILYSLTAIPSDTTSATKINSGNGVGAFTTSLTGLTGGTLYHIRAFVVNSAGVGFGADITFTTGRIPTLTTLAASSITSSSAVSGGNITSDGGSLVYRRGVVWNVFPISDTGGNPHSIDANGGIGTFLATIPTPVFRTYYVLAFAVNANGVAYGNLVSFQSLMPSIPIVTTITSNVTSTSALVYNNVGSEGSSPVTRRGLVWSINPITDTTSGTKVIDAGTGLGNYTSIISGLLAGTTYYSKAFAVNAVGVAYGSQYIFTTYAKPTVATTSPTSITSTSANGTGSVNSDGGTAVYRRGIVYGTSPLTDTTSGTKIVDTNAGIGSFSLSMIPLVSNTTYYVMAFAVNSIGVSYGGNLTFRTLSPPLVPVAPTVVTSPATSITTSSAISGGNVTLDGGASVFRRGLMYSTTPITDTTTGTKIIAGTSGVGAFSISLTSLSINTKYYIRAFALNSAGVSYGSELNFTIVTNNFKTRKKFVQRF